MNKRISSLLAKAHLEVKEEFGIIDTNRVAEKFAELIIFDVLHTCLMMQHGNQYTPEELLFQTKYRKIVREHFGVEQ